MGAQLGFYFNGKELEMVEILRRREAEDRENNCQARVVDLPIHGITFTLSNNREGASCARLDRFLVSPEILSWFPKLKQKGLPRSVSDHNSITLGEPKEDWGPCPFRVYNNWIEDGNLMKQAMKCWKEKHEDFSMKIFEARLVEVDKKADEEDWTESLRQQRLKILMEIWKGIRKEEQMWRQKSRVKWLKKGDKNSKFFHSMANGRRRTNLIGDILFDGVRVSDPTRSHFKNVPWQRPKIRDLNLKRLSEEERDFLERPFTIEEVQEAVSSCDGNKAPGQDGMNLNFIKANWEVIQEDFLRFIHEFYKEGAIVEELNKTFIALIPKGGRPETMSDFQPISLVGSMYKVLAKILANRLKSIMDTVIGETQMAFVKKRQIIDSFVIADEIIHSWRKDKVGGNGRRVNFWNDPCGEELPLKFSFPRIYALALNKNGVVEDFGRWQGSKWVWEIPLRRPLFD
ncbi:hypothetical protein Dsin_027318 [Dipteronia sinensis]|uniref:Reverse transcriptase domain-containing protein n=1 Tax=Dipteronia sinensis TaxID=43782 RepID=A0AAD9ZNR7_9ROSI|nr:hypothetical protein Dsin_027318 [Dipteronia sinensis]